MPFLGKSPTAGFASIVKDDLTPNGSTTAFTLSKQVANANDIAVFLGNVRQEPTDAYTVSGTTLTMSEAPATGLNFYVLHIAGTHESSVVPADNTISTAKIQSSAITDVKIAANAVTTAKITNANITQAKLASGVAGNGPAFHAHPASAQSISAYTFTKVTLGTEVYDTDSKFASSRFTPTIAGYYQINASVTYANANFTQAGAILQIRRNGSNYAGFNAIVGGFEARHGISGSALVYLDSDDYVEMFIYGPANTVAHDTGETHFSGGMVRSA